LTKADGIIGSVVWTGIQNVSEVDTIHVHVYHTEKNMKY